MQHSLLRLFSIFFCLAGSIALTRAELPPSAYEKMQIAAPEVLRIKVLRVEATPKPDDPATQQVATVAQVLKVGRSASKVKPDDLITIKYDVTERPKNWVGPGAIPILTEDAETIAYLRLLEDGTDYVPVAGAMSFNRFVE